MPQGRFNESQTTNCRICNNLFTKTGFHQKYCSTFCKRKGARATGCETTDRQYALISGSWERYFNRLCARSFKREGLTSEILISLLKEQGGKCKLSGVELTCILQKGVVSKTNASIDRIDPKGAYTVNNIQLVCSALNKFRIDTPLDEFIEWCRKVADYAIR